MKKNLFFAALAITALVSCSENDYLGDERPSPVSSGDDVAIEFGTGVKKTTRADLTGAAAADKLNNNFVFLGTKTVGDDVSTVFDHYNANWKENTANTTLSNSNDWEYVGETPDGNTGLPNGATQSIKYWDYAASRYDFAAYSLGKGVDDDDDEATDNAFATASRMDFDNLGDENNPVYTLTGTVATLKECYISDLVTHYNNTDIDADEPTTFGKVVNFSFRSLATKIRLAFYETVPGYSVKEVKFYTSANATLATDNTKYIPTLFTGSGNSTLPTQAGEGKGTMSVYFPTTGWTSAPENTGITPATDYNKALVTFVPESGTSTLSSTMTFEQLAGFADFEKNEDSGNYLGRTSNAATYAGGLVEGSGKYYTVLPNEKLDNDVDDLDNLMIRIQYTLVSTDGSDEEITVDNAKAVIPKQFANWHPNYAYTYIFKISNMTNGTTGVDPNGDPVMGLTPITLNAVVVDSEDGVQETITTVADPSITTYMAGKVITDNDEYIENGTHPIFIVVNGVDDDDVTTLTASNAKLYIAEVDDEALQTITEQSVDNALRYGVISGADNNIFTVTDANSKNLVVTEVGEYNSSTNTGGLKIESGIPAAESPTGDAVTLDCASFVPVAGTTYVFQYLVDAGTPAVFAPVESVTKLTSGETYYNKSGNVYTKVVSTGTEEIDGANTYYTIEATAVTGDGNLTAGETYYTESEGNYTAFVAEGNEAIADNTYYTATPTPVESVTKLTAGQTYYTSNRGAGKFTASGSETIEADKYWVMTNESSFVPAKYMYKIIKVE